MEETFRRVGRSGLLSCWFALAGIVTGFGTGEGGPGNLQTPEKPGGPGTHLVRILDNTYEPSPLIVSAGDTVVWVHQGSDIHTTTGGEKGNPNGEWDSGEMSAGDRFGHVFLWPGSYPYFCKNHYQTGMIGLISVREPVEAGVDSVNN